MEEYQSRVVEEYHDLGNKIDRLGEFIEGDLFQLLDYQNRTLLLDQSDAMIKYLDILNKRIELFKKD